VWKFPTGDSVHHAGAESPDGSALYVPSEDKMMYAIKAADGTQLWASPAAKAALGTPAVSPDGQ
jgi:outer membrane protein assembly factor BamB